MGGELHSRFLPRPGHIRGIPGTLYLSILLGQPSSLGHKLILLLSSGHGQRLEAFSSLVDLEPLSRFPLHTITGVLKSTHDRLTQPESVGADVSLPLSR